MRPRMIDVASGIGCPLVSRNIHRPPKDSAHLVATGATVGLVATNEAMIIR